MSTFAAPIPQAGTARVIEVTAERFEFWPSEITIDEGEEVEFRITSEDTIHGFRLVGTNTSLVVPKRGKGVASAKFTGPKAGRYRFECHRMCGAGHNFMSGVLIVRPKSSGLSGVEGPGLSGVEGPGLSGVEGPGLSGVEGPGLSGVEGR